MSREFLPFNLDTMSGVHPGTRTAIFQRVRVGDGQAAVRWHLLQWYSGPDAAILTPLTGDGDALEVADPKRELATDVLATRLAQRGQTLRTCGTCHWWKTLGDVTPDGLRSGICRYEAEGAPSGWGRSILAAQSSLALECPHWTQRGEQESTPAGIGRGKSASPIPKSAELDPDRLPWWKRASVRIARHVAGRRGRGQSLDTIVERSGVGAGTEPCFACQGRIANLGAIAVGTPDGDKQTYSVWRCRACYSLFLNDWVDRWERLDSLETEETYYRLSPSEAGALLTLIRSVQGGEHPARRNERGEFRERFLAFAKGRERLSHQIRQGR